MPFELFALLTAVGFAFSAVFIRLGVEGSNPQTGNFIVVLINFIAFALALFFVDFSRITPSWFWAAFLGAGTASPALSLCTAPSPSSASLPQLRWAIRTRYSARYGLLRYWASAPRWGSGRESPLSWAACCWYREGGRERGGFSTMACPFCRPFSSGWRTPSGRWDFKGWIRSYLEDFCRQPPRASRFQRCSSSPTGARTIFSPPAR